MDTILLTEDDQSIAMGLIYSLTQENFTVLHCKTVEESLQALTDTTVALAILDITLPDGNGYDICRKIRETSDIPVIFLTACDEEVNVVMGLDMGADDYITKPFRIRELISRIKTVLRRYHQHEHRGAVLELGDLTIFPEQGKVFQNGREVVLTVPEYRLLMALVNNKGQILTRSQLLEAIWDVDGEFVNDNTLSVCIKRLREKIEANPGEPSHILTVRGLGYKAIS